MADRKFLIGAESSYDTVATTWRRLEFDADDFTSAQSELTYTGIGTPLGAPSLSTYRSVAKGGTGTLTSPIYANGLGILNRAAGSTFTSGLVSGGTAAYEQVTTFDAAGPQKNRTISVLADRDRFSGTLDHYVYRGGMPTQVEATIDVDAFAKIAYALDFATTSRETSYPSGANSPTTPSLDTLFAWRDLYTFTLTNLDTDDEFTTDCIKSIKVTIPSQVDTEDWCLGPGAKHAPTRNGVAQPTLEIAWKYQDPRYYDAYKAGTPFSLSAMLRGPVPIEGSTYPSFTIDIPAFVYDPNDPQMSPTESTMQTMAGKVMTNPAGDPPVTFTQVTSDTAY